MTLRVVPPPPHFAPLASMVFHNDHYLEWCDGSWHYRELMPARKPKPADRYAILRHACDCPKEAA
jgi:hypothetical protein